MKREYCTYFDHRYAARGITMIRSLRRAAPDARIWVLCLDAQTENLFAQINEPGVVPLSLSQFENGDEKLLSAKQDGRSLIEYYFTCTASLVRYVMRHTEDAEFVTYLDGDLWFFADPEPLYEEMAKSSVLIVPHRFPRGHETSRKYGIHNVGWVTFRNSPDGLACLDWWREKTLEWCFDVVDEQNDRFADQRYLDSFSKKFAGVHSLHHAGANLAPWNIKGHKVSSDKGSGISVDGHPLIFFHFHGMKRMGKRLFLTSHGIYGARLSPQVRDEIYRPYLKELLAIEHKIGDYFTGSANMEIRTGAPRKGTPNSHLRAMRGYLRSAYAILRGLTVWANER